jgi:hypothetical protein
MKRNRIMLAMLVLAVCIGVWAAGRDQGNSGKSDLAGRWELDISRSSLGKMKRPTRMTLEAMHHSDTLHAIQTSYFDQAGGPDTVEGDWFLDGKEHPLNSDGQMISMSKWDGNTLVAERKSRDGSFDETIRLTVSSDGKTATENIAVKDPNGSDKRKLVWQKKG